MKKIVIAIPIYKNSLDTFEQYSLDYSLSALAEKRDLIFIGPQIIEQHYYSERYPSIPFLFFDSAFFASAAGYSQLLLSKAFYEKFTDYEFLLVLQTLPLCYAIKSITGAHSLLWCALGGWLYIILISVDLQATMDNS